MTAKGTPVVILFLLTILVLVFSFLSSNASELNRLRQTIEEQNIIIDNKTILNRRMMTTLETLYTAVYGSYPDATLKYTKDEDLDSPIH